ncbi:MAG: Mur ligase family protein, partial [Firmicutes bacterium]|nr:Mur ligase family protein [Bacillota bacterium]
GTMDGLTSAFREYIRSVGASGLGVLCFDDPRVRALAPHSEGRCVSYGVCEGCDYRADDIVLEPWKSSFKVIRRGSPLGRIELRIPGIHNVVNSLAAAAVGMEVGVGFDSVREALSGFHGVQRRIETVGVKRGVRVLDDYAHHPTEIRATLRAVRRATDGRIICIFQPHRFSRTFLLKEEFGTAFGLADELIILDIYPGPGEKPLEGVTSKLLVDSILRNEGKRARYIKDGNEAAEAAAGMAMPGDTVITVGAGDVWTLSRRVLEILGRDADAAHGHAHQTWNSG